MMSGASETSSNPWNTPTFFALVRFVCGLEIRASVLYSRASEMKEPLIVPIVLAAGSAGELSLPKALALFGRRTAVEIALTNCRGRSQEMGRPILVLGERAEEIQRSLPPRVLRRMDCIVNRRWREGQLTSVLAALRHIPPTAAFMLYPVDLPLLTRDIIERLVSCYRQCAARPCIVMPCFRMRYGHPVIFSADLRGEIVAASTARDVAYRDPRRIYTVNVRTSAIWTDFSTPAEYARCLRRFTRQTQQLRR
jgi:CTP:molybdopterin cytidylyltransferase MocA